MFSYFKNKKSIKFGAESLFEILNKSARNHAFFGNDKVEDSPDGRFELVALFCTSIFCAMANRGPIYKDISQKLFDIVFKAFDQALRELGVGDMAVAKRIRKMSESFYGRQKSYMDLVYQTDSEGLSKMIARNVFNRLDLSFDIDNALAQEAIRLYLSLKDCPIEDIISGQNLS